MTFAYRVDRWTDDGNSILSPQVVAVQLDQVEGV
jgi:hypothetical protein